MKEIILEKLDDLELNLKITIKENCYTELGKIREINSIKSKWCALCYLLIDIDEKPVAIERQEKVHTLFKKASEETERLTNVYKKNLLFCFSERIKEHYPHTISIRNTVDKEYNKIIKE